MANKPWKLTDEHRAFLVRELACYAAPAQAVAALKEEFGVIVTPEACGHYDPSKRAGKRMAAKWRELFKTCRRAFLDHMEDSIPEAHKAVRVRGLARAARRAETRGNDMGMAQFYEQIAKELGNVHTNRRELSGPAGKPMQLEDVSAMGPEQVADELRAHMQDPAVRAFVLGLMNNGASPTPAIPAKAKAKAKE